MMMIRRVAPGRFLHRSPLCLHNDNMTAHIFPPAPGRGGILRGGETSSCESVRVGGKCCSHWTGLMVFTAQFASHHITGRPPDTPVASFSRN